MLAMPKPGILKSKSMFCVIYRSTSVTRPIYMSKKKTIFRVFLGTDERFWSASVSDDSAAGWAKKLVNADIEKVKQALTEQGSICSYRHHPKIC